MNYQIKAYILTGINLHKVVRQNFRFLISIPIFFKTLWIYKFTYKKSLVKFWKINKIDNDKQFYLEKFHDTITVPLFIEKNLKTNLHYYLNFRDLISIENLYITFLKLKNNSKSFVYENPFKLIKNDILIWFKKINKQLIKGNLKYSKIQILKIFKLTKKRNLKLIVIQNFKIQIIKKIFYDNIVFIFNKSIKKNKNDVRKKKHLTSKIKWQKLKHHIWINSSLNNILKVTKNWNNNIIWILNGNIQKTFNYINKNRLKNIFLSYIKKLRIWKEVEKILNNENLYEKMLMNNFFTKFLFDIYLNKFDRFIDKLFKIYGGYTHYFYSNINQYMNKFFKGKNTFKKKKYTSIKCDLRKKQILSFDNLNKNVNPSKFVSSQYLRSTNNFLIGIEKFKKFIIKIQKEIHLFLNSNLHLKLNYYKIVNWQKAYFLFFNYKISFSKKLKVVQIEIPFKKLTNYLGKKRFTKSILIINLDNKKIINYYSNLICYLMNYYRLADHFDKIKKYVEYLKCHCYYILSEKYKKSFRQIQNMFKKNLKLSIANVLVLSFPSIAYFKSLEGKFTISKNFILNFSFQNDFNYKILNRNIKFNDSK